MLAPLALQRENSHCRINKISLAKKIIPELNHSSSPYLSPPEFFLFHKIKSTLKERRLEDTENIKRNATKQFLVLHENNYKKCFQQSYKQSKRHVIFQGVYLKNIKRYIRL
jgi:hypothetical protein